MASLTGKSRVGSTRASVGGTGTRSRPSVGGRNFKVFSEIDRTKVGEVNTTSERGAGATLRRNSVVANKGVILNNISNPKGGLIKSSNKGGTSPNTNVRKALVDVSNVQKNFRTTVGQAGSIKKVLAGSSTKIVDVSLRKTFVGRVQRDTSKGDVQLDVLNRGNRDDHQTNNTNGGQSVVATKDRFSRRSIFPTTTRKSLPVPRRVSRENTTDTKENVRSSRAAKGKSDLSNSSQPINARSYLWKNRVSDGFGPMAHSSVSHASSRKSTKPIVKTTVKAYTAQRTLKSKSVSGQKTQNKLESTASTSSLNKKTVPLSLPENGSTIVSDDAKQSNQSHLPLGESSLRIDTSDIIPKNKSSRRKSYTTSLIEGSKFLKESGSKKSGEGRELDNLPNIDDERNQLEVSEYIDEIYQYYWVSEAHNPVLANYMSIQTDITPHLRGILINWLIEVHMKFDLMPETLYLTVTLLDQYLSQVTIKKTDLQLVGLTALLLASKYEDFWHPRVKDLISISAESCTRDQMLGMEKLMLRKLKFRLNTPTPYVFMVRFLKAAQSDKKLEHMAFFLVDLSLVEYEALAFKPSLLCASALYVARCTLLMTPPWTQLLQKHARYEVSQIRDCADMLLKFHKAAGIGKLKVAYEKYSRQELSRVAAVKPLDRLPQ